MAELLLELFSEEIPARMQDRAREDLRTLVKGVLDDELLRYSTVNTFATPRRLSIVVSELQTEQFERTIERRGPREDAPEQARNGFLRTLQGLDYELSVVADRKGRLLIARIREGGQPTAHILATKLPETLAKFPWLKSMRWGSGDFRWVRPLQSVLCLFDSRVVPFEVGGVRSGDTTRGHRFMSPEPFPVRDFTDYVDRLGEAKVILNGAKRREIIERGAEKLAAAEGLAVADDPALLDELKGLVEWPVPLLGAIDEPFMELPPEVLVSTMRNNQKYLALRTRAGALAPRFVLVANTVASDGGAAIVAGNERVLRARLWDAKFFWDQDLKDPLESRLPALDRMVFHAGLGTQRQRVERLVKLAGVLVPHVPRANRALAERAALLAKADLVTGMVGEFPELQGIIGAYYARAQGETSAVVASIRDQYAPKGPDDRCPSEPNGIVLALAEKIDMLVGFFAIGQRPTGSKDPFGLRRASLGTIRIILDQNIRLPLRTIFTSSYVNFVMQINVDTLQRIIDFFQNEGLRLGLLKGLVSDSLISNYGHLGSSLDELDLYCKRHPDANFGDEVVRDLAGEIGSQAAELLAITHASEPWLDTEAREAARAAADEVMPRVRAHAELIANELMSFLADRLKVHLRESGVRHDLISAAFAVGGEDDLVRLLARVDALQAFVDSEDGRNLLAAYRRASNIVGIEERKEGRSYIGDPVASALVEPAEEQLHAALDTARSEIDRALAAEEYGSAMAALARLRRPVDSFFDAVMVNAPEPDLRINRLLLLSQIRSALGRVADFSLVEDNERAAA
jgi:glycyl-tRNA synthetase beta chain